MADLSDDPVSHTTGPWHVDGPYVRSDKGDAYICDIKFPLDDPEIAANARLIAAAPELLTFCRDIANRLACECGEPECGTTRLRAVLAKVEGRS